MIRRRLLLASVIAASFAYRAVLAYHVYAAETGDSSRTLNATLLAFAIHVWVPLLCLVTAAFVGLLRPQDGHALRATFMFLAVALVFSPAAGVLPPRWEAVSRLVGALAGAVALPLAVLLFFLAYPSRSALDVRAPWLKLAFPLVALALLGLAMLPGASLLQGSALHAWLLNRLGSDLTGSLPNRLLYGWIFLQYFAAFGALGSAWGHSQAHDERRRLLLIFSGASAGTLPLFVIVSAERFGGRELPSGVLALLALTIGLFPLSFVYAVLKHRVFGVRLILRRGLQYALVSRAFLFLEALVLAYALYALVRHFTSDGAGDPDRRAPLLAAGLTLGLVVALDQLNRRVFPLLDRRFFREAYDARQLLMGLSRAVRRLASRPAELIETVKRRVDAALHPRFVSVLLKEPRWSSLAPGHDVPLVASGGGGPHLDATGVAIQAAMLVTRLAAQAGDSEPKPVAFRAPGAGAGTRAGEGLLVPIGSSGAVHGFLALGEKQSEEPYSREDKELLTMVADQTAAALENALLFHQVAEQDRLRREVEIAREVQHQLFPRVFPPLPTLRYCGSCLPARAVGGDYYDFIALGRSRLGIALGDIAGKGISAALLMTSLHAMLRSHALLGSHDLPHLVGDINRLLYEATDAARYATFFYGVYEAESRRLRYVNAGHIPPILVRPEDTAGTFHRLCEGGPVIGVLPDPAYEPGSIALRPGDVLVIVSDGVSEAESPAGEMFGEDRVARLVAEHAHNSELEIRDAILREVERFRAGAPQGDDTTLVVAKVS